MRNYRIEPLTPDPGGIPYAPSSAVGLIVLTTDMTSERDFARLSNAHHPGIDWYVNRIPFANPITEENLCVLAENIERVAGEILPDCPLDAVVFNCTSGSALIGDLAIARAVHASKPSAAVITTAAAAVEDLRMRGCGNISLLTPYDESVSESLADYFETGGLTVQNVAYMHVDDDRKVAALSRAAIIEAAKAALDPRADALFISCTAMRAVELTDELERMLGLPVCCSNGSVFRHTVRVVQAAVQGE